MIPKVIHYCWFGGKPVPKDAKKCIKSWKKFCPDYEIKEWNEKTFDLDLYPYVREAYDSKKFAFVTDVVRLYALYNEGGIYMDTDVEVLSSLDPYLHHCAFSGFEAPKRVPTGIMASERGGQWVKDNLAYYGGRHFIKPNGELDLTTNVTTITNYMVEKGLILNNQYQEIFGYFAIYPNDYFCPKSWEDGKIYLTKRSVTIHHFRGSWIKWWQRNDKKLKDKFGISYPFCYKFHRILNLFGLDND